MLYSFAINLKQNSSAIKSNILLGFKNMSGISYLGIFRPLLAVDWVLAKKLLKASKVYTA